MSPARSIRARFPSAAALAAVLALFAWSDRAVAQDANSTPPAASDAEAAVPALGDYDPVNVSVEELRLRLLPLRRAELVEQADAWVDRLERQAKRYVDTQLTAQSVEEDERPRIEAAVRSIKEDGAHLVERANIVVAALRQKGGDVEEYKQYITTLATVMTIENQTGKEADKPKVVVPKLPPYDPLTVSTDELKLRLRRLRKTELQEEVETWLGRLQAKTEQIVSADIAARTREGEQQQQLIDLATKLKEERVALVERTQVALDLLDRRGGDVAEYQSYVKTISGGLVEDLSDLSVTDAGAVTTAWNTMVAWGKSTEGGQRVLKNVGMFLAILFAAWILAGILARVVRTSLGRFKQTSVLLRDFLVGMTKKIVLIIGLVVAVSKLGVDIGPLIAAIGAAGLVIGFALQGTLSNFASGIMILLYRPYDVGDAVEVSGVTGKVEAMTMVSTTILTFDNQLIVVPNNSVWGGIIKNITGKNTRRIDMMFGISYSDDIDKARSILEEIVVSNDKVLKDPEAVIRLHELADSSVNFVCRPWARTADYWDVYWDVTREVKRRFDAANISIPFPQQDVHVHRSTPDISDLEVVVAGRQKEKV